MREIDIKQLLRKFWHSCKQLPQQTVRFCKKLFQQSNSALDQQFQQLRQLLKHFFQQSRPRIKQRSRLLARLSKQGWQKFVHLFQRFIQFLTKLSQRFMQFSRFIMSLLRKFAQQVVQFLKELYKLTILLGKKLVQFVTLSFQKSVQFLKWFYRQSIQFLKWFYNQSVQFFQELPGRVVQFVRSIPYRKIFRYSLRVLFVLLVVIVVGIVGGIGVGLGTVSAIVKNDSVRTKASLQQDLNSLFENSIAYFQDKDQSGQNIKIGEFRNDGDERKLVRSLHDVSPYLQNAFLAVEDRDFYSHNGIVPRSLVRAAYQQVTKSSVKSGGSTITQQLVKNVILKDRSKDIERKAREIVLALRVDWMFPKDEIFIDYMNSVYFGNNANGNRMYGVEAAAHGMFNEDAKDLKLAQAAYIAGMVQRPNALNPFSKDPQNIVRGVNRMKIVLKDMLTTGKITQQEYNDALAFDIKGSFTKPGQINGDLTNTYKKYSFVMNALENEAAVILMQQDHLNIDTLKKQGKFGSTLEAYKSKLLRGGYHVYTSLDQKIYDAMNSSATSNLSFTDLTYVDPNTGRKITDHEELGAVMIDNQTGGILGFVSGTNRKNLKDHALSTNRQPGSSIKPLLDYGPALQNHIITPNTLVLDAPLAKGDGTFYKNFNGQYVGLLPAHEALKRSYNLPALRVFAHVGHNVGFSFLQKMDMPINKWDYYTQSVAIGGFTDGFTVKEMTAAYSTFPRGGVYLKPYMVSQIVDNHGHVIYTHYAPPVPVYTPQLASLMNTLLREVVQSGTAVFIGSQIHGYDMVGKTGTTNNEEDLWFIGYTPQITMGAWGGYDYHFTMHNNLHFTKQAWVNMFLAAAAADSDYFDKNLKLASPTGEIGPPIACLDCSVKSKPTPAPPKP